MITTTSSPITFVKTLKAGTATSYLGLDDQFHISLKNDNGDQIITEGIYTIIDATLTTAGSISIDIPVVLGTNRMSMVFSDNSDLDIGIVILTTLGSGGVKYIVSQDTLNV